MFAVGTAPGAGPAGAAETADWIAGAAELASPSERPAKGGLSMHRSTTVQARVATALSLLLLSACGGGGAGDSAPAAAPSGPPPTPTRDQLQSATVSGVFAAPGLWLVIALPVNLS